MSQSDKQGQPRSGASAVQAPASLLDLAINATKQTKPDRTVELLAALASTATDTALRGTVTFNRNVTKTLAAGIEKIDAIISKQLAAIMHDQKFQKLEGSWRGLKYLVSRTETGEAIKLRVMHCRQDELLKDFEKATEFDQSTLFGKIYSSEFGVPGGTPYGALIGDYEFKNHPDDIALLKHVSGVAAAAFCPFISAASSNMIDLESWDELAKIRDLASTFESLEYVEWKSFRESDDSRFVALTMPRTLARLPYGNNTKPIDEFHFEEVALNESGESVTVPHDQYCWMNSAFVMGAQMTHAFATTSFCTAIRGMTNGGRVDGLPAHVFYTDEGDVDMKCPTEVAITDRRELELSGLGFLPLSHYKSTDYAVFMGGQTAQRPKKLDTKVASENAQICARLPYVMATSRFAHYLKVMARDWIGSAKEADDLEAELTRWIMRYVSADPKPSEAARASTPLRAAKIQVLPVAGKSGAYDAVAWLQPFLQMEELTTAMKTVARIPQFN